MQKVLTAGEMREVDRLTTEKYGIPSILLMENAASAVAGAIKDKFGGSVGGKSLVILCGKGSNGGDGAALGRILWTQGALVRIHLFGKIEETKGDARVNFEALEKIGRANRSGDLCFFQETSDDFDDWNARTDWRRADVLVDALFGTGLTRKLENFHASLTKTLGEWKRNNEKPFFVSVDIPSGLNSDVARLIGENLKTDLTVTFTAPKLANVLPPASNFNGELVVANIGSPLELIEDSPSKTFLAQEGDAKNWLEKTGYASDSYKNKRGHALLIVGSREYTGAAILAAKAAMASGVGLTTAATPESAQPAIAAKISDEIITRRLPETKNGVIAEKAFEEIERLIEKIDALGIGCGLGKIGRRSNFVREIAAQRKTPIIIDADGLNALAPFDLKGDEKNPIILTPHEGEFLRLLGTTDREFLKDRVSAVREFAEKHQVILVLKGERVLIGAPDGRVVINPTGNSGLGKAGNGDTLTGIITGFVAQAVQMKVDIFETIVAAVYISSLAGDIAAKARGRRSMQAGDVRESLSQAFARLESGN